MDDYDSHIKQAKNHLYDAHNKMHSDEGIVFALLGIGHILLAQELSRMVDEADYDVPEPPRPSADRG